MNKTPAWIPKLPKPDFRTPEEIQREAARAALEEAAKRYNSSAYDAYQRFRSGGNVYHDGQCDAYHAAADEATGMAKELE